MENAPSNNEASSGTSVLDAGLGAWMLARGVAASGGMNDWTLVSDSAIDKLMASNVTKNILEFRRGFRSLRWYARLNEKGRAIARSEMPAHNVHSASLHKTR